ncbi:MAG: HNH endonuclease [Phycisphaerales bacterium]
MHRMIMRPHKGRVVHHIDRNGLNNRRDNLQVCTPRQHLAGRGPCGAVSQFVGVYRHGDKWEARIRSHGKVYHLGYFDDEVEAAKARDRKAYELHGKFAYLNFPENYAC